MQIYIVGAYIYVVVPRNYAIIVNMNLRKQIIFVPLVKYTIMSQMIYLKDNNTVNPLDIEGITTDITTQELIDIVREQREL